MIITAPLARFSITLFICLASLPSVVSAQLEQVPTPRQEKLLNGLKVLMWNDSKADKVWLKVRVHSGSAFDPQGKEGVMKLIAAHIFPTIEAREFFEQELGGQLEVISNYDYIQINASSRPDKFLDLFETVANAINNLNVDKDSTAKLKAAQIETVKQLEKDPVYKADQTVSGRLLGTFPYGRAENGTLESLSRIDFADLLFAKERFFTADNATVTISGNFDSGLAFRALRRFFGNWLKADKKTPTAFKQPEPPDTKLLSVRFEAQGRSQLRYAIRGVARNDKDYVAAEMLSRVFESRLGDISAKQNAGGAFVRNEPHVLPGVIIFGYSADGHAPANLVSQITALPVTGDEFARSKAQVIAESMKKAPADWWLDAETFKLTSVADDIRTLDSVTLADVQRVQDRLAKNPMAAISVSPSSSFTSN